MNLHSILRIAKPKSHVKPQGVFTLQIIRLLSSNPYWKAFFLGLMIWSISGITPDHAAAAPEPRGLKLVASVAPQEYLLKKLKTPQSTITVVIRPGQSPATWDPSPRQMHEIIGSDIMFPIGVPFENIWLPRLRQRAPELVIADTLAGIERVGFGQNHRSHNHDHENIDPHIWLDPLHCIRMAENMTAALQRRDPDRNQFYAARLEQLRTELNNIHREIKDILAPLKRRTFMVFHPSWGYFAARYNLHQIALEKEGKEPSGAHLAQLIELAQQQRIGVIFVQQQFSTGAARAIAAQTGARIETLDPLRADLAESLRDTAHKLARSLAP